MVDAATELVRQPGGGDLASRRRAALQLGQLCDRDALPWSAQLAAWIECRGGTAVRLGRPDGVLLVP